MKRSTLFVLGIFVFFLFVSCGIGEKSVEVIDMTELNGSSFNVKANTEILLTNMDPSVMYRITKTSSSSSSSSSSRSSDSGASATSNPEEGKQVFSGNEGEYHPIPDENKEAEFQGKDVGIRSSGEIIIEPLNTGNGDMIIEESDPLYTINSRGERVWEEYYHIDFSEAPYNELDKSRISLRICELGGGSGGSDWGYVTENAGGMRPTGYTAGLYDFSDLSYVNLYSTMYISYSSHPWSQELIISNPVKCNPEESTSLPSKCCVLAFNPEDRTKNYVLEVKKANGVSYSRCENYNLRCIDGAFTGFPYEISENICYLGKIESELLVDMTMFGSDDTTDWGSVVFRPATAEEEKEYSSHIIALDSSTTSFTTKVNSPSKQVDFIIQAEDFELINNSMMKVECRKADGSYPTERTQIRLRSGHTYGVGYSQNTLFGAYYEYRIDEGEYLVQIGFYTEANEPLTVTVSFEKSSDIIRFREKAQIIIVPENGTSPYSVDCDMYSDFSIPVLSKEGYTFKGMYYNGKLYKPGEIIKIESKNSSMIASWEEEK